MLNIQAIRGEFNLCFILTKSELVARNFFLVRAFSKIPICIRGQSRDKIREAAVTATKAPRSSFLLPPNIDSRVSIIEPDPVFSCPFV